MKTKKMLLLVLLTLTFNVGVYSQEKLVGDTDITVSMSDGNTISDPYEKGRKVENGLFFTKSTFGNEAEDGKSLQTPDEKRKLSKTFELTVDKGGSYFFAAHILPANNVNRLIDNRPDEEKDLDGRVNILEVSVYLNGLFIGTLNQTKLEWELVPLKETKAVNLEAGKNIIRFESDAPYYPMVDAVRIAESEKDILIKNKTYDAYVDYLKSNPNRSLPAEKETQDEIDKKTKGIFDDGNQPVLRSAMFPDSYSWQMIPSIFPCPFDNKSHRMNVPIVYTYYRLLSLSAGSYTFITAPISGDTYTSVDPVMYLYKSNDPHTYTWSNDDDPGYGFQSRISVSNIPAGDYYLVIRAYSGSYVSSALGRQGLVNVYQNGSILNSNVPVSGYMFDVSHDTGNRGDLNYFTAYSTGIPVIWLLQNVVGSEKKMKFKGATFFYINPMDYMWFDDARVQFLEKKSSDTYSMLVSAEGAMSFYFGNCDAYGNVPAGKPSNTIFPNFKKADAMISAPSNGNYNCHAWAGGISTQWFDNLNRYGVLLGYNYGSVFLWSTWDNYYGNNPSRYAGATTYTRNQATSANAEIALWSYNSSLSQVSHSSVRLLANNNPHGYDWESKCGGLERVFHPRNALSGSMASGGYGNILDYYRDANKNPNDINVYSAFLEENNSERDNLLALRAVKRNTYDPTFTMEESIEKGLTVIEDVKLDNEQLQIVKSKSDLLAESKLQTIYNKWIHKIKSPEMSYISSIKSFIDTEEGEKLIAFAKNDLEESIVFFANVVFANDESSFEKYMAEYLFCEIVKDKYAPVIEKIKEDWLNSSYDKSGRYIAPMPETFAKKYIKELLNKAVLKSAKVSNQSVDKLIDNDWLANISPNPVNDYAKVNLNLKNSAVLTVRIYSQNASLVETILNNKAMGAGVHSCPLNTGRLRSGVYICVIEIDGVPYSRKFLKR